MSWLNIVTFDRAIVHSDVGSRSVCWEAGFEVGKENEIPGGFYVTKAVGQYVNPASTTRN